ncbi:MAG: (4Fe-4S)-binding protein [Asgard group archaeon]|nr:(4Fe-4S)-binding protein [Asgard group archaeon]
MPKQITIISGKGGTGKTIFTAGLAYLTQGKAIFADADVDAPDLHLILKPEIQSKEKLMISKKVKRDEEKCTRCGLCEASCRYQAITSETIFYFKCEGCGLCTHICPEEALKLEQVFSANLYQSDTRFGPFVHVDMAIGEGSSGMIVSEVRKRAQFIGKEQALDYIIVDGSPGIGCPVIASITGIDLAVIIIEPTLSGLHDLERVIGISEHFKVKPVVCINKYDLNLKNTNEIISFCKELNVEVVGKISFDEMVPFSIVQNKTIFEVKKNAVAEEIKNIWKNIQKILS